MVYLAKSLRPDAGDAPEQYLYELTVDRSLDVVIINSEVVQKTCTAAVNLAAAVQL